MYTHNIHLKKMNQFCGPLAQLVEQVPFNLLHTLKFLCLTLLFNDSNLVCTHCAKNFAYPFVKKRVHVKIVCNYVQETAQINSN